MIEINSEELIRAVIALFVIVDPVGLIPIVISLTSHMQKEERKKTIKMAVYVSTILLVAFALAGQQLLQIFGISLSSFSIAGGLLLLALSFELLIKGWSANDSKDTGVIPLAFPLMAGPGAITTVILTLESSGFIIALISVGIVSLLVMLTFYLINPIYRILGRLGTLIVSKVMAIFIAAIAIEFILKGISNL
ncbi:MAG: MarC family protein [Candidatus Nitrosothermus koennekii]|nr:MAG: MarC family protein [Candidatus Nitrosothermus koennekii]